MQLERDSQLLSHCHHSQDNPCSVYAWLRWASCGPLTQSAAHIKTCRITDHPQTKIKTEQVLKASSCWIPSTLLRNIRNIQWKCSKEQKLQQCYIPGTRQHSVQYSLLSTVGRCLLCSAHKLHNSCDKILNADRIPDLVANFTHLKSRKTFIILKHDSHAVRIGLCECLYPENLCSHWYCPIKLKVKKGDEIAYVRPESVAGLVDFKQ